MALYAASMSLVSESGYPKQSDSRSSLDRVTTSKAGARSRVTSRGGWLAQGPREADDKQARRLKKELELLREQLTGQSKDTQRVQA